MEIRDRIRQVLDGRPDLNPTNVGKAAGLSNSMMHKYLAGETRSMSVDNLVAVAGALGVNPQWLMFGDGPQLPAKVVEIWDRILQRDRARAIRILETLAEDASSETA